MSAKSKKRKAPPPQSTNTPSVADLTEEDLQIGTDIHTKLKKIEIVATFMRMHWEDEREAKELIDRSFKKQRKHMQKKEETK